MFQNGVSYISVQQTTLIGYEKIIYFYQMITIRLYHILQNHISD